MDVSFTSTKSFTDSTRAAILKLQNRLAIAQQEVASGRLADVGVSLGAKAGFSVSLRQELANLKMITDTNSTASTRLDATQSTLDSVVANAKSFTSTLIACRDTDTGPATAQSEAKANLISLMANLNSTVGGDYLFAGINTGTKPITDYYANTTPAPYNKQAVDQAFLGLSSGATQSDPNNKTTIDASAMTTFLNDTSAGSFDSMFQQDTWSATWSSASDQNIKSRISASETIDTSSNANNTAYRKLAEAYTMVAELGVQNLNKSAYQVVIDKAIGLVGEATQGLVVEQGRLGTAQSSISNANQRMSAQNDIITNQINAMETVDPYDASTRVTTLETQLQTAYSLTARIQKLSLLNYL